MLPLGGWSLDIVVAAVPLTDPEGCPREAMRIAQEFTPGLARRWSPLVPEGRLNPSRSFGIIASLRDAE